MSCATRTQHELFVSCFPSRSQWNCTFTRPYLSVRISSPLGPTTTAVWVPAIIGFGVTRGGRKISPSGMQENDAAYRSSATPER